MNLWEKLTSDKLRLFSWLAAIVIMGVFFAKGGIINWDVFKVDTNTGTSAATSTVLVDAIVTQISHELNMSYDDVYDVMTEDQMEQLTAVLMKIDMQDKFDIISSISDGDWTILKNTVSPNDYNIVLGIYDEVKASVSK